MERFDTNHVEISSGERHFVWRFLGLRLPKIVTPHRIANAYFRGKSRLRPDVSTLDAVIAAFFEDMIREAWELTS
jgi:hypothetical protein